MTKKVIDFTDAERKTRKKDFEIEQEKFREEHNGVSQDELQKALETINKATGQEYYIGTKKALNRK